MMFRVRVDELSCDVMFAYRLVSNQFVLNEWSRIIPEDQEINSFQETPGILRLNSVDHFYFSP